MPFSHPANYQWEDIVTGTPRRLYKGSLSQGPLEAQGTKTTPYSRGGEEFTGLIHLFILATKKKRGQGERASGAAGGLIRLAQRPVQANGDNY